MAEILQAQDYELSAIQEGRVFTVFYSKLVPGSDYLLTRIRTGNAPTQFFFSFFTQGRTRVEMKEVDEWGVPGDEKTPTPLNGNTGTQPTYQFFANPDETQVITRIIPSLGSESGLGLIFNSPQRFSCGGFVLKFPYKEYLVTMLNLSTQPRVLNYVVSGTTL